MSHVPTWLWGLSSDFLLTLAIEDIKDQKVILGFWCIHSLTSLPLHPQGMAVSLLAMSMGLLPAVTCLDWWHLSLLLRPYYLTDSTVTTSEPMSC